MIFFVKFRPRIPGKPVLLEHLAVAMQARIALFFEFAKQLLFERGLQPRLRLFIGEVFDAIPIGLHVEQFLARAFSEIVLPILVIPAAALVEQQRLDGAGVAIEVASFRIARGPAIGLEVVQVKMIALANAADGITPVIRPAE